VTVALELAGAFVLITLGALGFTNAIEWLGERLDLGSSAVGALLAAVGTALPESVIPIVALLTGSGEERTQIAIGAIVGAPFVLATLAMVLVAVAAHAFSGRREQGAQLALDEDSTRRDLWFVVALLPIGVAVGLAGLPLGWRLGAAAVLLAGYGVYVWRTVATSGGADDDDELQDLFFDPSKHDPPRTFQIVAQLLISLAAIIGGAELFVTAIESIAMSLGVPVLVLALVLAPLATELPEKANSVLWIRDGKDTLAVGNITGAMVFQSTLPMAFGMVVTGWVLEPLAVLAGSIAVAGAALALWALPRGRAGPAPGAAWAALFAGFVVCAVVVS
jgi:cation:H+ antiporter